MTDFHLQAHIQNVYESTQHQYHFTATDKHTAMKWQTDFRAALQSCLKIDNRTLPDMVTTQLVSSIKKDGYVEEKHVLMVDDVPAPLYVLIPDKEPPYTPVAVFHGHGMGVNLVLGNYDNEELTAKDENFAARLAQDGYLVCAIEQRGFGERVTDQTHQPVAGNACRHLAFSYMMHDRTLLGERVWDAMHVVSYLLGRGDIIAENLTTVGFSGGGTTTLFLSAVDMRIQRTVIKSYFCKLQKSILGVRHCECNYVPDLLTLGDTGDVAGLIAPRPVLVISGETDPIFPIEGVREQFEHLQTIYDTFDAEDHCTLSIHPDGHRARYDLIAQWLS